MTNDDLGYFESEEFKQLLAQYESSARQGHPIYMDADDLADIADYYHMEGNDEEAEEAINLALQFNPDAVGPLLWKARLALTVYDFETARQYAERIKSSDHLEYLYLCGEILICEEKEDEADALYRQYFMEVPPDEQEDFVYDVANIYSEYGLHDKAFEWIARSQGDDSDEFKELMARTLFGQGKYKDSARIFNELIDHDPFSKRYWNQLASAQYMNEDYGASVTSSEYAIAIDPDDAESILAKANGLYRLDNLEEALTYYQRYTEKVNDDEFGHLYLGVCLINQGRPEEAIRSLEKAEEVAPADSPYLADIYLELAFAYSELKMPDSAFYYLDKTIDLDCDHTDIEVIRGHIYLSNGRMKEAMETFQQTVLNSGNTLKTMLRILVSFYDNRYVKAAYLLFNQFFTHVNDDWTDGYAYMALCCWDLKLYDEFLKYLQIAVEKNPKESKVVLAGLFPRDLPVSDYYDYIQKKLK